MPVSASQAPSATATRAARDLVKAYDRDGDGLLGINSKDGSVEIDPSLVRALAPRDEFISSTRLAEALGELPADSQAIVASRAQALLKLQKAPGGGVLLATVWTVSAASFGLFFACAKFFPSPAIGVPAIIVGLAALVAGPFVAVKAANDKTRTVFDSELNLGKSIRQTLGL